MENSSVLTVIMEVLLKKKSQKESLIKKFLLYAH